MLLLYVLILQPQGTWDPSSMTRERTGTPALEGKVLTTGQRGSPYQTSVNLKESSVADSRIFRWYLALYGSKHFKHIVSLGLSSTECVYMQLKHFNKKRSFNTKGFCGKCHFYWCINFRNVILPEYKQICKEQSCHLKRKILELFIFIIYNYK